MPRPIETAVKLVTDPMRSRAGYPIPPLPDLVAMFIYLVASLREICAPTPAEGQAYLTWRPYAIFDWRGKRLELHRRTVEVHLAAAWRGGYREFRQFADSMWARIDEGALTPEFMAQLYQDAV